MLHVLIGDSGINNQCSRQNICYIFCLKLIYTACYPAEKTTDKNPFSYITLGSYKHLLKLKIIRNRRNRNRENRALQGLYFAVLGHKKDRIGIVPSQYIIHRNGHKTMRQFVLFVIPLDIEAQIQTVKIWNPKFVTVTKSYKIRIVKSECSYGIGYGSTGLVHKIGRYTVPPTELIVRDQTYIMGLIKVGSEKFSIVDTLLAELTIKSVQTSGIGIAQPTIKIAPVL